MLREEQTEHHFKLLQHVLQKLSQDELECLLMQTTKSGEDTVSPVVVLSDSLFLMPVT